MRRAVATVVAAVLGAGTLGAGTLALVPTPATGVEEPAARAKPAYSETKTVQRVFERADGSRQEFPAYDVTVTADQTTELRGRQRIRIAWSGAQPSGGRASNPYGESGLAQEYPVVIMQCRGVDDPGPGEEQLRPETCWTASVAQRSQITRGNAESTWRRDLDAEEADKVRVSGLDPLPSAQVCPTVDLGDFSTRLTPFEAASGRVFPACQSDQMPPEAAVGAAFPPAELAAFTDLEGNGEVQFEVRSDVENESLGCNNEVACSIVVIPIVGLSCDAPSTPPSTGDQACRRTGRFTPGSGNFAANGVDQAVSPGLWWSASNWKHRFSIPISFGLPPDTCDVLDPRAPTGFYGTELLAQAALQWAPAYCLRKDRFKFQHNQMSDEAGFALMENGGGPAALVSSGHEQTGSDPVGYAPTAVTGFAVAYVVDKPDNAGEVTTLRLTPRLVAKLLTQSYLGSDLGRGHPGIEQNPLSIIQDPEFVELNPGLPQINQEAGATLLSLSNESDVVQQLTEWVVADKDARDFIAGKEDPWGMVVNPNYRDLALPASSIPLLDDYVPETGNTCRQQNPAVYFNQLAAPVTTLRRISEAILDAHPNVQTRCEFEPDTGLFRLGRIPRQSFGARFMLGVVSLGDAARFGLRTAALQAEPGSFVTPDADSLAAAVALMEPQGPTQPFVLDQQDVRRSGKAYPGTMVVYTAARMKNLPKADAATVAQFIRIATTEGQRQGPGNGQLPGGFLPLRSAGPTAPLLAAARQTADAVATQTPPASSTPPEETEGPDTTGGGTPGGAGGPLDLPDVPVAEVPDAAEEPAAGPALDPVEASTEPVAMPATTPISSRVAGMLLPLLFLGGLLGALVVAAGRFFVRPPRAGLGR
ncbi:hypothetical protein [Nocardioides sp.]|uniref:hypothetical protein n=1 Tax=Nocardioides sp. TaxID=35761 RepID=UPI0026054CBE|nr:hypothetical protein [Nocardioides sp.]